MEKENWIESILNSTNGVKPVEPNDDLFSKIKNRIKQQDTVSAKTVWLVAASIAVLVLLNFSIINSKSKQRKDAATAYLEMTINQSNQLYK
ncbi:MAG TPA: hypothetical protein PKN96_00425 [Flavobacterium sp.]|uniref:hypothetical protein n=1 Tax=Flavobacterium sp. TaxID=239 RepID=UPI002B50CF69|nr:hypothetical protein [Flavobacterium sp.]HNP31735.1 hypothetical protein [Flavobacterium sp.]